MSGSGYRAGGRAPRTCTAPQACRTPPPRFSVFRPRPIRFPPRRTGYRLHHGTRLDIGKLAAFSPVAASVSRNHTADGQITHKNQQNHGQYTGHHPLQVPAMRQARSPHRRKPHRRLCEYRPGSSSGRLMDNQYVGKEHSGQLWAHSAPQSLRRRAVIVGRSIFEKGLHLFQRLPSHSDGELASATATAVMASAPHNGHYIGGLFHPHAAIQPPRPGRFVVPPSAAAPLRTACAPHEIIAAGIPEWFGALHPELMPASSAPSGR